MKTGPAWNEIPSRLQALLRHSILSADEELRLLRRAQAGDTGAVDLLLKHNCKAIMAVVLRYARSGVEIEDLFDEGAIGFCRAVKKYDLKSGYRLLTYAVWWIRQAVSRCVMDQSRTIRLPVNVWGKKRRIERARAAARKDADGSADALGAETLFEKAFRLEPVSLDEKIMNGGDDAVESTLAECLQPDSGGRSSDELMSDAERQAAVNAAIKRLSPREQAVIIRRFFLEKTLAEIAEDWCVSRERVRQIEVKALDKLRRELKTKINDL